MISQRSTDPASNGTLPDPTCQRRLIIMVKEPVPGRIKSRLARETSTIFATRWYRIQTQDLIRRLAWDSRWTTTLAMTPDHSCAASRVWPVPLPRMPQGPGDLGLRLRRIFRDLPPGPVVLIGSDIPGITARHINDAFRMLGRHQSVLGPSHDGGYWLIGLRRLQHLSRRSFLGVRWSTCHAFTDTVESLSPHRTGLTAILRDIDTRADLARVKPRRSCLAGPAENG